jgi:hypothetical protein
MAAAFATAPARPLLFQYTFDPIELDGPDLLASTRWRRPC